MDQAKNRSKVIIQLTSEQWYSDGEKVDPIKLITPGLLEYNPLTEAWTVSYEESAATGMEGTKTYITLYPDKNVRLHRVGTVEMDMVFQQGKQHISQFATEFGLLDFSILTNEVGGDLTAEGGNIRIGYSLNFGHKDALSNKLYLKIKEDDGSASDWLN